MYYPFSPIVRNSREFSLGIAPGKFLITIMGPEPKFEHHERNVVEWNVSAFPISLYTAMCVVLEQDTREADFKAEGSQILGSFEVYARSPKEDAPYWLRLRKAGTDPLDSIEFQFRRSEAIRLKEVLLDFWTTGAHDTPLTP